MRGLAIIAVILYHSGFLPGGYLGVDVFFVLSGFLITSLLLTEWRDAGAISLRRFYLRRVLRLLPALLAVVGMSIIFGMVLGGRLNAPRTMDAASGPLPTGWTG